MEMECYLGLSYSAISGVQYNIVSLSCIANETSNTLYNNIVFRVVGITYDEHETGKRELKYEDS